MQPIEDDPFVPTQVRAALIGRRGMEEGPSEDGWELDARAPDRVEIQLPKKPRTLGPFWRDRPEASWSTGVGRIDHVGHGTALRRGDSHGVLPYRAAHGALVDDRYPFEWLRWLRLRPRRRHPAIAENVQRLVDQGA